MKVVTAFFFFYLFCSLHTANSLSDSDKLKDVFKNAPILSNDHFDFGTISEADDKIIDSLSFVSLYQVDSLLDKSKGYYSENPVYIVGKKISKNFDALVTIRYYGEWFKTIDFLTYNKQGKLIGILHLASYGGDADYSFESSGYFSNNYYITTATIKYFADEYDDTKAYCYKRETKNLLNDRGEIFLLENRQTKVNCM